jgi:hypothetical protein
MERVPVLGLVLELRSVQENFLHLHLLHHRPCFDWFVAQRVPVQVLELQVLWAY